MHPGQKLLLQIKAQIGPKKLKQVEDLQNLDPKNDLFFLSLEWLAEEGDRLSENAQLYQVAAIILLWRHGKLSLKLDPELANSLASSTMIEIPTSVLNRIPFRNFYLSFDSDCPMIWTRKSGFQKPFGTFIRFMENSLCEDGSFISYVVGFNSDEGTRWQPLHSGGTNGVSLAESLQAAKLLETWSPAVAKPTLVLENNEALLGYLLRVIAYLCS